MRLWREPGPVAAPMVASLWALVSLGMSPAWEPQAETEPPVERTISSHVTVLVAAPARFRGAPVLVFFHGGGWRSGDKSDLRDFARRLANHGVIVVLPNYRLAPGSKYPAQAEDAVTAVAWAREQMAAWSAESECLFIGGHSAGGHLAALIATDHELLASHGLSPDDIAGVVGVSGVYRIAPQEGGATREFVASVFGDDEAVWRAASPVARIAERSRTTLPPFALVWSGAEHPLVVKESVEFARALHGVGARVIERQHSGQDHEAGLAQVSQELLLELSSGACAETPPPPSPSEAGHEPSVD